MTELTGLYIQMTYVEKSVSEAQKKADLQSLKVVYAKLKTEMPVLAGLRRAG
ncbi:MAG: hypothetical protein ACKVIB_07100 [Pseudomonadales bacterium]